MSVLRSPDDNDPQHAFRCYAYIRRPIRVIASLLRVFYPCHAGCICSSAPSAPNFFAPSDARLLESISTLCRFWLPCAWT
jgi:hypothetical protein